ncbi:MAG: hypothetical protein JW793_09710 [Acidobacteria bacterium]|nr:hypothetical protein [Acidobacteriota bacterium]
MIIICEAKATEAQVKAVENKIKEAGLTVHRSDGVEHTILGVVGDRNRLDIGAVSMMPGVRDAVIVSTPYKLASREFHPEDSVVRVGEERLIGGLECGRGFWNPIGTALPGRSADFIKAFR